MDDHGYFYFKDRQGDTFRWKGENVSTAEVESIVSKAADLRDCAVYGVEIPGADGKAGMASIVDTTGTLDLAALATEISTHLPSYARPLFIRILKQMDMTGKIMLRYNFTYKTTSMLSKEFFFLSQGTYKIKVGLQNEGYDITKIPDVYFLLKGKYVPVDAKLRQNYVGKIQIRVRIHSVYVLVLKG